MGTMDYVSKPTKSEQKTAMESYNTLEAVLRELDSDQAEIEIEETKEKIVVPSRALRLLGDILKAMSEGKPISIIPIATEVTTQKASELLGCSRPHLIKLLEDGKIEYTKVGKHRRIRFEDVMAYKKKMKAEQKQHLIDMMNYDEDLGL